MNAPERIEQALRAFAKDGWFLGDPQFYLGSFPDDYTPRNLLIVAAERIAALEAEKAKAEAERDALRVVQNLHSRRKLEARADKAEALLAEAVEALEECAKVANKAYIAATNEAVNAGPSHPLAKNFDAWRARCFKSAEAAFATLAKITEAKNG